MSFVLDNSVTMRWFFGDGKPQALANAGRVLEEATVPASIEVETRPYGVTGDIPACVSRDAISLPQQFSIYLFSAFGCASGPLPKSRLSSIASPPAAISSSAR